MIDSYNRNHQHFMCCFFACHKVKVVLQRQQKKNCKPYEWSHFKLAYLRMAHDIRIEFGSTKNSIRIFFSALIVHTLETYTKGVGFGWSSYLFRFSFFSRNSNRFNELVISTSEELWALFLLYRHTAPIHSISYLVLIICSPFLPTSQELFGVRHHEIRTLVQNCSHRNFNLSKYKFQKRLP